MSVRIFRVIAGAALAGLVAILQPACSKTEAPGTPPRPQGPLTLDVDASDVGRKLLHAHETMPAMAGPMTIVYPKWLPGEHAPTGPITDLVGLKISAAGKPIAWTRDSVDMYAFRLDVPAGVEAIDLTFDFLSASSTSGFSSAASATPHLAVITWNQLLLYPQGARTDDVKIGASVRLPAGWRCGTSLKTASATPDRVTFEPVSLTTLVDSPVLAGEFFLPVSLDASSRPVQIDLAADSAGSLEIPRDLTNKLKRLVVEADALFGARHFDEYHFLLSLSDHVAHFGLEHHQSNDSRVNERAVVEESPVVGLVAHEFVHSWNGKYRRPAGLATPDFQQPMRDDLLWVYEGLTHYLGFVLAARSGVWSEQYYRERLAQISAHLDHLPGREWRPLADVAIAAPLLYSAPQQWESLRRGTDFYDEGWLIWLDVDTLIRERTNGSRSLDDFCRSFFGGTSGSPAVRPYTIDDVTSALNDVAPYDWKTFLASRLNTTGAHAPLDGVTRSGWQIVYNDVPNEHSQLMERGEWKRTDTTDSIGLVVHDDGAIIDAVPGSPAFAAGIGPGMKLLTINGKKWSPQVLRGAVLASGKSKAPLALSVQNEPVTKTFSVDYHGSLREPHLDRVASTPDRLHDILTPRAK
jgi:predicted metalloprotease with PDZ domain